MRIQHTIQTRIQIVIIPLCIAFFVYIPLAHAQVFKSQPFGIQIGDGVKRTSQQGDNLIYGVLGASATGSLLLLQNGSGNDRFKVDTSGNTTAYGKITGTRLCIQGNCRASWPSITETDTLLSVTNRGNTTTQAITVATVNTGLGAREVYPMSQHMRTTDNVTFAVITASGNTSTNWNIAYNERQGWDGGNTGLTASTGRTSLGLGALSTLSSLTAYQISTNVLSSLDGVYNDGGNIDLVEGANITITPDDANNQITISSSGATNGWSNTAGKIYLTIDTDKVGIGNNAPSAPLHVGSAITAPWTATRLAVSDASSLYTSSASIAYIESSGAHSGNESTTLQVVSSGQLTDAQAAVVSLYAQSGASWYGDVLRLESEDANINYLQARNAAGTVVSSLTYAGGAYFGGNVGIAVPDPQFNLAVSGTAMADNVILGTYGVKPTCDANNLADIVFDTLVDMPYVCTTSGWNAIGSDADGDGIMNSIDSNDSNIYDATAYASDVVTGKTFYTIGTRQTGTAKVARPGCVPGSTPGQTGDLLYDYCDNDHDGAVDEMDVVSPVVYQEGDRLLVNSPGQTCYRYPSGAVWAMDGQFPMSYDVNAQANANEFCRLREGSSWYSVGYTTGDSSVFPCVYINPGIWWLLFDLNEGNSSPEVNTVTCDTALDNIRN